MDSYLHIARKVLLASRRPMTARAILKAAYAAGLVPPHLFGKTQDKTLQARLSEDILTRRLNSHFFRTRPGYFFLSEFASDPTVPEKYKEPFTARRRTRDLRKDPVLLIRSDFVRSELKTSSVWIRFIQRAQENDAVRFATESMESDYISVCTFSIVTRNESILSYRLGRYRDDRDTFANKKTIGFINLLSVSDRTLFSQSDYGASANSLSALLSDLDISPLAFEKIPQPKPVEMKLVDDDPTGKVLLLVMAWTCPDWFEPTTRRLSLNHPLWIDFSHRPNDLDDFEPWSRDVLLSTVG